MHQIPFGIITFNLEIRSIFKTYFIAANFSKGDFYLFSEHFVQSGNVFNISDWPNWQTVTIIHRLASFPTS